MQALVLQPQEPAPTNKGDRYDQLVLRTLQRPDVPSDHILIRLHAASLNHRDVFIRQGLYPRIKYGSILGSDGAGVEVETGRRVLINPSVNWKADLRAPEKPEEYGMLGLLPFPGDGQVAGTVGPGPVLTMKNISGTLAEYIVVPSSLVHEIPSHLSFTEAAALPLAGLTAYRATFSQGQVNSHSTVLISGIGGGVALFCLQFCVAVGAKVYVTSSDPDKIQKAVSLGAHGGANYREADWEKQIRQTCPAFDVVIDSAGGDAIAAYLRLLRPGGTLVTYGATARPAATILMPNIFLKQITVKGSTMGNEVEFANMLKLVADKQLRPVVSAVWKGLSSAEDAMEVMRKGGQMGKLVIELCVENSPRL